MIKKTNIVGIVGFAGSGKDTLAKQFLGYGYEKYAFADTLKDILSVIFGWNREYLEGDSVESREWREKPDEWWENKLDWHNQYLSSVFPRFTPRVGMQLIGTDVIKKHFNDNIWILSLENKIKNKPNVIISDCRFPNEIKMIKDNNGLIIKVTRGESPEWLSIGIDAANGNNSAKEYLLSKHIHMSEWAWLNQEVDIEIINNDTPEVLFSRIKNLLLDNFHTQ